MHPGEFLQLAWNVPKLKHRAPNVLKISNQFNKLSNWSAVQLVTCANLPQRKNLYKRLVKLAKCLFQLNNFNSCNAIFSGLQNSSIIRLSQTLPTQGEEFLFMKHLSVIFDTSKSSKNIREHLHKSAPPLVPFLGMYLTDLTFIDTGSDTVKSTTGKELHNWKKASLVYKVLAEIECYQQKPYNLCRVQQIQDLIIANWDNHQVMDEQAMFRLSLQLEKREK